MAVQLFLVQRKILSDYKSFRTKMVPWRGFLQDVSAEFRVVLWTVGNLSFPVRLGGASISAITFSLSSETRGFSLLRSDAAILFPLISGNSLLSFSFFRRLPVSWFLCIFFERAMESCYTDGVTVLSNMWR
jgi:hypothetical protein